MITVPSEVIQILKSPEFNIHIKLEIFDHQYKFLGEYSEQVTSDIGTINLSNSSPARRSLTVTLDNSDGRFTFDDKSLVWLDKRVKFYIGVNIGNKPIYYIPQGVYVATEPSNDNTPDNGSRCAIELIDLSYLYTDKRGKLKNYFEIPAGRKITDTIRAIANAAYPTRFNFDEIEEEKDVVPYVMNYNPETSRWEVMQELASKVQCSLFFDAEGYLRLKKIDLNDVDISPVVWEFKYDGNDPFYAGSVRRVDTTNIANSIRVIGGNGETTTYLYDLVIDETNPLFVGHPYSIQRIGEIMYFHNNGNHDGVITSLEEAKYRAKYELMRRAGYDEIISLSSFPVFILEPDDAVWIEDRANGSRGRYLIETMAIPISPSLMTFEARRPIRVIENWDFI